METPTRFDLDLAVAAWRRQLTAQPDLAPADVAELETHLREAFAELRRGGLAEAEAFLVARHRVGPPAQIADEFAKAAPARYWRRCLFWAAGGALVANLWQVTLNCGFDDALDALVQYVPQSFLAVPLAALLYLAVFGLPVFLAMGWFLRRRARAVAVAGSGHFWHSRWRLAVAGILTILATEGLQWWAVSLSTRNNSGDGIGGFMSIGYNIAVWDGFITNALWPVCLLALMVWLLPRREPVAA
ncbi:MAG: permease prefix domain 1-containing protein [Opitutales bacterium]|jgi:hypothetical protein